jgi:hypothetical protein
MPNMKVTGRFCQIAGGLAVAIALALAHDLFTHRPTDYLRPDPDICWENLGHRIGLGFGSWAQAHHGQYPFNVSTNEGGTRELCVRGSDGFDRNAWRHFQVLSNELADPAGLVCPKDRKHKAARDFQSLGPENVSYRLRTGPSLTETNKTDVLITCPLDGKFIYADGNWGDSPFGEPAYRYASTYRQGLRQVLISLGAGALLIGLGMSLKFAPKRSQ